MLQLKTFFKTEKAGAKEAHLPKDIYNIIYIYI